MVLIRGELLVSLCFAAIAFKVPVIYDDKFDVLLTTYSGQLFGWFLGTALISGVALKGIAEKRYILIYPFIVVLLTEIIVFLVTVAILFGVFGASFNMIIASVVTLINTYALICLISMYQSVKKIKAGIDRRPILISDNI
ncbi:hypothetical protein FQR65_LT11581 [Abscondita terminalis]|nr:hypothetical protein FQR65_LT11581 [Abscondita terminalis]